MNRKRRMWIIIGSGIVITFVVVLIAFRLTLVCCALPPTPPTLTAMGTLLTRSTGIESSDATVLLLNQTQTAIASKNDTLQMLLTDTATAGFFVGQTRTAVFETAIAGVITATPSLYPYDATLYAQRRHEEQVLQTGAGPTQYAIFYATETGLAATYQGTVLPTSTPIPYTADMSPTVTPTPRPIRTATPTLCPASDVICPGGNATMSAADKVMILMASAKAPEFVQFAQTATALAVTPTPSPIADLNTGSCAWSWAHRDLPDTAQAVQETIVKAGMTNVQVIRADAFGEECSVIGSNKTSFGAMTTDFYLSVTVSNLNDANELAKMVINTYNVLTTLKVKLPARPGYLDIVFTANGKTWRFRAMFDTLKPAIDVGKTGAELLAVGGL